MLGSQSINTIKLNFKGSEVQQTQLEHKARQGRTYAEHQRTSANECQQGVVWV